MENLLLFVPSWSLEVLLNNSIYIAVIPYMFDALNLKVIETHLLAPPILKAKLIFILIIQLQKIPYSISVDQKDSVWWGAL